MMRAQPRPQRARTIAGALVVLVAAFAVVRCAFADDDKPRTFRLPGRPIVLHASAAPTNADPANPASPEDVITQRNNNLRTGTTLRRRIGPSFVADGRFGFIRSLKVDGVVLAQPLYMAAVNFPSGRRSAVFITTSTNWIYAFDADSLQQIWARQLAPPLRIDDAFNDHNSGSCTAQMVMTEQEDRARRNSVVVGIESTPAIDAAAQRMLVSYRAAGGMPFGMARIASIDLRTGQTALTPGGGLLDRHLTDNPYWNKLHRNRASLLLDRGIVYIGFSALCEGFRNGFDKSFQGWIYAYDARTLAFAGRYRTTQSPAGSPPLEPSDDKIHGGGIWQASTGLAADGHGNIYIATGNARPPHIEPPDAAGKNLSSSVIRVHADRQPGTDGRSDRVIMTAADWFTPYRKVWQDEIDLDLGAAGVVLMPNTPYLFTGGKEGVLYVLNRHDLGKFDHDPPFKASDVEGKTTADVHDDPHRDRVVQKFGVAINQYCATRKKSLYCFRDTRKKEPPLNPDAPQSGVTMDDWIAWPHLHGTPVFGVFGDGRALMYVWPEKDHLKSFAWNGKRFETLPTIATALPDQRLAVLAPPYLQDHIGAVGMPGGMLSLVIDPEQPASGILFASVQRCRSSSDETGRNECTLQRCDVAQRCREQRYGSLRAFDPITMRELWNNQRDPLAPESAKDYWFAKYVPPTFAKGRVFLATASGRILVYGRR